MLVLSYIYCTVSVDAQHQFWSNKYLKSWSFGRLVRSSQQKLWHVITGKAQKWLCSISGQLKGPGFVQTGSLGPSMTKLVSTVLILLWQVSSVENKSTKWRWMNILTTMLLSGWQFWFFIISFLSGQHLKYFQTTSVSAALCFVTTSEY